VILHLHTLPEVGPCHMSHWDATDPELLDWWSNKRWILGIQILWIYS